MGHTPFSPAERSVKSACCAFSVNTQLGSAQIIAYEELLAALAQTGASWVQIDDPILVLDLPAKWQHAFQAVYHRLQRSSLKILLASYFGALGENFSTTINLPVAGLHIELRRSHSYLQLTQ